MDELNTQRTTEQLAMQASFEAATQSRLGDMMMRLGESRIGRAAAATTFLLAGAGGAVAATEGSAAASPSSLRDGTETAPPLAVTPVNDMYSVYAGVRTFSLSPILNDTPNGNPSAVEAVQICGIGTADAGITIVQDPYNTDALNVSVASTVTGEHHTTVTYCDPAEGSSASADLGLNVTAVHNVVVKKLKKMKHGLHMIKLINNNDVAVVFNGSYSTTGVPAHKSKRQLVPRVSKYTAFIPDQLVSAGKGRIKFPR